MSKQVDLSKPLDQETIDELLTKHSREKVEYWVALASGSEFAEDEDLEDLSVEELRQRLKDRDLSTTGNKAELIERLQG